MKQASRCQEDRNQEGLLQAPDMTSLIHMNSRTPQKRFSRLRRAWLRHPQPWTAGCAATALGPASESLVRTRPRHSDNARCPSGDKSAPFVPMGVQSEVQARKESRPDPPGRQAEAPPTRTARFHTASASFVCSCGSSRREGRQNTRSVSDGPRMANSLRRFN